MISCVLRVRNVSDGRCGGRGWAVGTGHLSVLVLIPLLVAMINVGWSAPRVTTATFPRTMGMNIGLKNYDDPTYQSDLARLDVVILGFYPGWSGKNGWASMAETVRAIKAKNPNILVGQYTVLSETQASSDRTSADGDKGRKLDAEGWWLRDADGDRVQWTDRYAAFDVNISGWARQDKNGERYPEWLAQRDFHQYFKSVPQFDIWFFDNALGRPAVTLADWDGDGRNDSRDDPRIASAYRKGHVAHWEAARRLYPAALLIGNSDDVSSPEYSKQLNGVFMEAVIGASWSMGRWKGWSAVMERYREAMKQTAMPHIVGFNVHGSKDDYQTLRYGLASCLLDDGYFSYTDTDREYSSVPWFDEYDVDLGLPIDPPPTTPWKNGVFRRNFQRGSVLVNPGLLPSTVVIESGYRKIKGKQAPDINDGSVARSLILLGKDGLILVRE